MAYLYQEVPRQRRASLEAHLQECPDCRADVAVWQGAISGLGEWHAEPKEALLQINFIPRAFRWALAALVILGIGCTIGRLSAPKPDLEAIRTAVQSPIRDAVLASVRQQLRAEVQADWRAVLNGEAAESPFQQELRDGLDQWMAKVTVKAAVEDRQMLSDFIGAYESNRASDRRLMLTMVNRVDQKHEAEHLGLRQALETVAVVAANKFQNTETQLGELASLTQARFTLTDHDTELSTPDSSNQKGPN